MTRSRTVGAPIATALAVLVLVAAVALSFSGSAQRAPGRSGNNEELEQAISTEARLDALQTARAAGDFRSEAIVSDPAPGWLGAVPMDLGPDDWEPAIAADPNSPYVYWLATRYGRPKPCPGNCPVPFTALKISDDGGKTWGKTRPLCACKSSHQYDPIIEVVPETGDVYALHMHGFNTVFMRSRDRGRTWTAPVEVFGNVSWTDKPALTTSADGKHVYVSFNGPTDGDLYMTVSHDFGRTWTPTRVIRSDRYFFAYDGVVLSDGTVLFSESRVDYSGPAAAAVGGIEQHVLVSTNRGLSWQDVIVDTVYLGPPCTTLYCYADFHSGHSAISADANDRLYHVYDGATSRGRSAGGVVQHLGRRRLDVVRPRAALGGRRALHRACDRGDRRRRRPRVVRLAERRGPLEDLSSGTRRTAARRGARAS